MKGSSDVFYERDLNHSQLEAVRYTKSPLLVLAGAGSGKTRVITYKIVYLIKECGLHPSNILAVTFTNKASNEMQQRIYSLLGENVGLWIKTFHSASAALLRRMGSHFGINSDFSIIDASDQIAVVKRILKTLKLDPETYRPEKYANLINRAKDQLLPPDKVRYGGFSDDPWFHPVYSTYEETLKRNNSLDFGDLIAKLVQGLVENRESLKRLRERFRYILIDEFQDTNHAQYALVKQLTLPEGNICVVGDDDQSIYGFRGARVENILTFPKDYAGSKIIRLEENYRSFQTILTASSHLIDKNPSRLGKTMYTKKGIGEKIAVFRALSDYHEAYYIARLIDSLIHSERYTYKDIAIFYRMNAQSRVFETVFSRLHIPYTIVGGFRFYEREEIKDILAYITLCIHPMNEVALRRIVQKPPRGIGSKTAEALIQATIMRGKSILQIPSDIGISPSRRSRVDAFIRLFQGLNDQVARLDPPAFLHHLYEKSGYLEWLKQENRIEKLKNLEELYNAVEEFSKNSPASSLADFLEEASLYQGAFEQEFEDNRVFLITLHNAKGLEFPVVCMAGMEDGVFPHFLSDRSDDLEEERRLCYVGMTRAMEKLYMTAAKVRKLFGRSIERNLSRFILDLPPEYVIYSEEEESRYGISEYTDMKGERTYGPQGKHPSKKPSVHRPIETDGEKMEEAFEVNARIYHKEYGSGRVVELDDGVALIEFDDGKSMRFLLKYTPIVIVKE